MNLSFDGTVVERRLATIATEMSFLDSIQISSYEHFSSDGMAVRAVIRSIELISQSVIDIAGHLVAHNNWGVPETYRDTIRLLARNNVIRSVLVDRLQRLVSMRNVLIHQYLEIDLQIIYESISEVIRDARDFISQIRNFLKQ
jgi:uncharacterized protein YutE (UPF0331/DUF86 family)